MVSMSKPAKYKDTASRIIQRMKDLDLKGVDITREIGASSGTISQWRSGQLSPQRYQIPLAKLLQCTPEWLLNGEGPEPGFSNVEDGPDLQSSIPVIGFATAGAFQNVRELEPYEVEEYVDSTLKQNGYRFALRIKGTSMENPADPKHIPNGSIVIFNAANKDPEIGQLVLAKVEGADETTFKKFMRDGEQYVLEPLNPRYDIITKPFRVLATAEEMTKRL